ncbi:hypothetical protein Q4F19_10565 [Sphingomonas sp. BIUV-7]|uniref:DUF423 domain-containing protein n=1 Tax=Sphingomonas natans TaxID=3063330 RepID=A0ABT8YA06_9SPHN|nr:hypothetical protein [Sphingomonas sp. BIUV-7]MDO6414822.1 hypothetical protein [Sphingomonas sp. BIUV-7]
MQINSTQAAGLLAFVPAASAAALAFRAAGPGRLRERRTWAVIAAIHMLFAVEVVAMTRHHIVGAIDAWLIGAGLYSERRPAQAVMLLVVVLSAAAAMFAVMRRATTRRSSIAVGATAALATLFLIESVSLHAVDALLYHPAGPVLLIGWLWLVCGWTTVAAAGSGRASGSSMPKD